MTRQPPSVSSMMPVPTRCCEADLAVVFGRPNTRDAWRG